MSRLLGVALLVLCLLSCATEQTLRRRQDFATFEFLETAPGQFSVAFTGTNGATGAFGLDGEEWRASVMLDANSVQLFQLATRATDANGHSTTQIYPVGPYLWPPMQGVDSVLQGEGAFMPMANGARFSLRLSENGLFACPANELARKAYDNTGAPAAARRTAERNRRYAMEANLEYEESPPTCDAE